MIKEEAGKLSPQILHTKKIHLPTEMNSADHLPSLFTEAGGKAQPWSVLQKTLRDQRNAPNYTRANNSAYSLVVLSAEKSLMTDNFAIC
jgi:hypothetical protein